MVYRRLFEKHVDFFKLYLDASGFQVSSFPKLKFQGALSIPSVLRYCQARWISIRLDAYDP